MNARTQCDAVASAQAGRVGRGWLIGTVWVIALLAAALPSAQAVEPPVLSSTNPTVPSTSTGDNSAVAPGSGAQTIATAARGSPAKRTHEGIQVHGHWTIEVRNPDGTLDKRVEFENGICHNFSTGPANVTIQGDGALVELLAGSRSLVGFYIELGIAPVPVPAPTTPACGASTAFGGLPFAYFTLVQNGMADPNGQCTATSAPFCFFGLNAPSVTLNPSSLTLSGQFLVPKGGATTITDVSTNMIFCAQNSPTAVCAPTVQLIGSPVVVVGPVTTGVFYQSYQFTGQWLTGIAASPAPVTVSDGQTVGVTVVLSFN